MNVIKSLGVARAAQVELEYLFLLARDLGLISDEFHGKLHDQLVRARKTLSGFLKVIEQGLQV